MESQHRQQWALPSIAKDEHGQATTRGAHASPGRRSGSREGRIHPAMEELAAHNGSDGKARAESVWQVPLSLQVGPQPVLRQMGSPQSGECRYPTDTLSGCRAETLQGYA